MTAVPWVEPVKESPSRPEPDDPTAEPEDATEPEAASPEPGARRRTGKGHVDSYGEGRVCAAPECETQLSRYNDNPACWRHQELRPGQARRSGA